MAKDVFKIVDGLKYWAECDNCPECQDKDPEQTYHLVDCTRHEINIESICKSCRHEPCVCDKLDDLRKYRWENTNEWETPC